LDLDSSYHCASDLTQGIFAGLVKLGRLSSYHACFRQLTATTACMAQLATFSDHLAQVIPSLHGPDFPVLLVSMLKQLVPADDATILVYPGTDLPRLEYFEEPTGTGVSTLNTFLRSAFLLDPYYLAAQDGKFGVFLLRELSPEGFRQGEYYRSWYRNCGYLDEVGYLVPIGGGGFVNIALGKTARGARFVEHEVRTLKDILLTIELLCRQHWSNIASAEVDTNLRAQLHSALEGFGSSVLTERETQVINLVLHGHSTKTLAEKLSISMETVKLHRKHAYAKLEVSSQAELFYLFLDSVMSARNYDGGDTLVAYMQRPRA
jgi:DNA-binding CsgD family transcriptional regulator